MRDNPFNSPSAVASQDRLDASALRVAQIIAGDGLSKAEAVEVLARAIELLAARKIDRKALESALK